MLTLTPKYYKYQMGQLAWTVVTIVITVVQVNSTYPYSRPRTR